MDHVTGKRIAPGSWTTPFVFYPVRNGVKLKGEERDQQKG